MSNTYGEQFRFTIFGQSHSPAIGVTMEGIPAGFAIDMPQLRRFLSRRAPGNSPIATERREADVPVFLSGLTDNVTCGAPITAIIENTNTRPADYENLRDLPRPGHADYPAWVKFGGKNDSSGGGQFSGRMTAPLCIAGGVCMQLLGEMGITIAAHIQCIGHIRDAAFDPTAVSHEQLWALLDKPFPLLEGALETEMNKVILTAKNEGDSVGGVIEVAAVGLPAGLGDPMFDGMENRIARLVFGIPAIRGIEFGSGFDAATMRGSRHNDPWYMDGGTVRSRSNHHGGILGGITTGMPLIFRAAVKPTPSIAREQDTVSLSRGENAKLTVHGRHDPCIVPRAVPVLEAAAAIAIYDAIRCGER